jgi:hypothetical protein
MIKDMPDDVRGFYIAKLTITILSRGKFICNEAVETITYAANCVEDKYGDTIITNESHIQELNEETVRTQLDKLDIEADRIGLTDIDKEWSR